MFELAPHEFNALQRVLGHVGVGAPIVDMVLSGNTNGKVFVRGPSDFGSALCYDNGFCVITGDVVDTTFAVKCIDWLKNLSGQNFFIVYPGQEGWQHVLGGMGDSSIQILQRTAFNFAQDRYLEKRSKIALPPEFTVMAMDSGLMQQAANTVYPFIGEMWKSPGHYDRNAIGYCIMRAHCIVSLCYSVFVGNHSHEIDILTVKKYQRMGLARVAASAFIDECLIKGLQPGWDCFDLNRSSFQLAESLGFSPIKSFPVYYWQQAIIGP